jgi:arginase
MSAEEEFKFLNLKCGKKVGIVGVPFSGGQPRDGVEEGPVRLVEYGLVNQLKEMEWEVEFDGHHDFKKLRPEFDPDVGKLKRPRYVSAVTKSVKDEVSKYAKDGKMVLTLGGDHSLAIGTVSGVLEAYPDACLIWVDAHADINTPETTISGNIHGCPVSFLLGITEQHPVPEFEWVKPILTPDRITYIGLRDCDPEEKRILKKHGIKAFSMHEVDRYGIGNVIDMAINHVNPDRSRPIHLSFDVDALDPSVAPSTGTPVRGGLTFREGHLITEMVCETGCLVAVDIMEVNPALEDEGSVYQTVTVGCSLARAALGETLL